MAYTRPQQAIWRGARTAGEFSPLDIPDLLLWLRADLGITKDGSDKVSLWEDQSGNGWDAAQATAARQPLWVANVTNGQPALRFDGVTSLRYMEGALVWAFSNSAATLMAVTSTNSLANNAGIFDSTDDPIPPGTTNVGLMLLNQGNRIARAGDVNNGVGYGVATTDPIVNFGRAAVTGVNAGTVKIYEGATEQGSDGVVNPISRNIVNYRIGRLFQDVFHMDGDYFELAVYSRALDVATEIAQLDAYATARYGL